MSINIKEKQVSYGVSIANFYSQAIKIDVFKSDLKTTFFLYSVVF